MVKVLYANATLYPEPIKCSRTDFPDLVQICCWDGKQGALDKWCQKQLGFGLPEPTYSSHGEQACILSTGPNRWLVQMDEAADLIGTFDKKVGTILDLGSSRTLFRLAGPSIDRLLNKGCAVDFSNAVTPVGSVIMNNIDHMGVMIHKIDAELYDLFVFSTYGDAMAHWLDEAACDMKLVSA